jgi:outer membrane immunogenic protein
MRAAFHTSVAALAVLAIPMAANAADLRVKAPPAPPMAPPFSWAGFYIGGNLGGAWAQGSLTDSLFGLNFNSGNNHGVFIGGGQVGFNYEFSNFVIGVEGDFDWDANNNNTGNGVAIPAVGTFQASANDRWLTTLAARFGWAIDYWLIYGKLGGGWVGSDNFTVTNLNTGASITGGSNTNSGWLFGGGVEWAFMNNWSAKIEYDYLGLNSQTFTSPGIVLAGDTFTTSNRKSRW